MSITIAVEVVRDDNAPYRGGVAVVTINGQVHAKLRSCEGMEVVIPDPTFSTRVSQPVDLNEAPICDEVVPRLYAGRCKLPRGHAGSHRNVAVALTEEER